MLDEVKENRKKRKKMKRRAEQEAYYCEVCDGWHLTSQISGQPRRKAWQKKNKK